MFSHVQVSSLAPFSIGAMLCALQITMRAVGALACTAQWRLQMRKLRKEHQACHRRFKDVTVH